MEWYEEEARRLISASSGSLWESATRCSRQEMEKDDD